jgi:hypothetical protein
MSFLVTKILQYAYQNSFTRPGTKVFISKHVRALKSVYEDMASQHRDHEEKIMDMFNMVTKSLQVDGSMLLSPEQEENIGDSWERFVNSFSTWGTSLLSGSEEMEIRREERDIVAPMDTLVGTAILRQGISG